MNEKLTLLSSLLAQKVKPPGIGSLAENEIAKHVLPVMRVVPLISAKETIVTANNNDYNSKFIFEKDEANTWRDNAAISPTKQFFPLGLRFEDESDFFFLPFEPMININGKNNVIKRTVAKNTGRGTIKERWAQDDYTIEITGFLMGENMSAYPRDDFEKVRNYLTKGQKLEVLCEPLQLLDIHMIVIEDFSFPFTKGENMQQFTINAVSDDTYALLIQTEKVFGSV